LENLKVDFNKALIEKSGKKVRHQVGEECSESEQDSQDVDPKKEGNIVIVDNYIVSAHSHLLLSFNDKMGKK